MDNYNGKNKHMNRAKRRKNGIANDNGVKRNYSRKDFEKIEGTLKKELYDLINESYSDAIKRERYSRLQPLIEEYNAQKEYFKDKKETVKSNSNISKLYTIEKEKLSNNPIYKKLNLEGKQENIEANQTSNTDYKIKKAISAYTTQVKYSKFKNLKEVEIKKNTSNYTRHSNKTKNSINIIDVFRRNAKNASKTNVVANRNIHKPIVNNSKYIKSPNSNAVYAKNKTQLPKRNISRVRNIGIQRYKENIAGYGYIQSHKISYDAAWWRFAKEVERNQRSRTRNPYAVRNKRNNINRTYNNRQRKRFTGYELGY